LILGATDAAGNKLFFQMAVNDSQEQAPTFAPLAEPSKQSQEAEMVLSSHPIKGYPLKAGHLYTTTVSGF